MGELTDAEKAKIWEDVRKAFPDDEMMQQIHYIREYSRIFRVLFPRIQHCQAMIRISP